MRSRRLQVSPDPINRKSALQQASLSRTPFGLFRDRRGVTAIEYAFIAGLVAIVIVTAVATLGSELSGLFNSLTNGF